VNARKWFNKAKEAYAIMEGAESKNVKEMETYSALFAPATRV